MYKTIIATTTVLSQLFVATVVAQNNTAQNGTACAFNGTEVTIEGLVMDNYCIDLGNLMDRPQYETLKNPEKHTIKCLADIPVCVESNYTILEKPEGADMYSIKYQLGIDATQLTRTEAQRVRAANEASEAFNAKFTGIDDGTPELKCVQLVESMKLTFAPDVAEESDDESSGATRLVSSAAFGLFASVLGLWLLY